MRVFVLLCFCAIVHVYNVCALVHHCGYVCQWEYVFGGTCCMYVCICVDVNFVFVYAYVCSCVCLCLHAWGAPLVLFTGPLLLCHS